MATRFYPAVLSWSRGVAAKIGNITQWENLCILHNILVREFRYCNFEGKDASVLRDFLEDIGGEYQSSTRKDRDFAVGLIHKVLIDCVNKGIHHWNKGKLVNAKGIGISKVISAYTFVDSCLSDIGKEEYSSVDDQGFEKLAHDLQFEHTRDIIRSELKGTIRGKYGCAFVTQSSYIAGLRVDDIPQKLGKTSSRSPYLIEVRYPADFGSNKELRAPTVLAAGPSGLFRSHCSEEDGWGRTICTTDFCGYLPEAVHEDCVINERFDPRYLGFT